MAKVKEEPEPRRYAVRPDVDRDMARAVYPEALEVLLSGESFRAMASSLRNFAALALVGGWDYTNLNNAGMPQKRIAGITSDNRVKADMTLSGKSGVLYQGELPIANGVLFSGGTGAVVTMVILTNTTGGALLVTLNLASGAASVANTIYNESLAANETDYFSGVDGIPVPAGYDIRGIAGALGVGITILGYKL